MAAKRNAIQRTLRKAQSALASYIKPGRRSAEASVDELLRVLHDTRITLMQTARKTGRKGARLVRAASRVGSSASKPARTAKRKVSTKAAGARRSAAAARRTVNRKVAALKTRTKSRKKPARR
jgi:hypothetical protein